MRARLRSGNRLGNALGPGHLTGMHRDAKASAAGDRVRRGVSIRTEIELVSSEIESNNTPPVPSNRKLGSCNRLLRIVFAKPAHDCPSDAAG